MQENFDSLWSQNQATHTLTRGRAAVGLIFKQTVLLLWGVRFWSFAIWCASKRNLSLILNTISIHSITIPLRQVRESNRDLVLPQQVCLRSAYEISLCICLSQTIHYLYRLIQKWFIKFKIFRTVFTTPKTVLKNADINTYNFHTHTVHLDYYQSFLFTNWCTSQLS